MKCSTFSTATFVLFSTLIALDARSEQTEQTDTPPAALSAFEKNGDLTTFEADMDMSDVMALFRQQQQELAAQRQLLKQQSQQIASLVSELDKVRAPLPGASKELAAHQQLLESQSQQIATLTRELDEMRAPPVADDLETATASEPGPTVANSPPIAVAVTPEQSKSKKAVETQDAVAQAQADDPSKDLLKDFKGAWRLPGTSAALAIGGYVKTSVVYNFDPLQIHDRFIVGSIPVGVDETTGEEAQSSVTADQSRLNFDLRQPTDYGIMRAFIEGDFAGSGETFRLRHAFGQWRKMLAGKTWTSFMDPGASPEELDFEGLNGRINVRQAQIRVEPTFGEKYALQISLEDPNPAIQNGSGVTRTPDVVLAGRFQPYKKLHMKLALMFREIRGQSTDGGVSKKFAWGSSLSGNISTPQLDSRDKFLFQLNYGNGIGRYVNDLSSIGNYDGIFEPGTEDLKLFDILAGYVSWQHWWGIKEFRSNFTLGGVDVNNPSFVGDDSTYKNTIRFSSNLIWSPMPRIDIGGEYLWGRRENQGGDSGDATQLQMAVRYRF